MGAMSLETDEEELFSRDTVGPLRLRGTVNEDSAVAMLDSGAGLSYVSPSFVERKKIATRRGSVMQGATTTGEKVRIDRYVTAVLRVGELDVVTRLFVVPTPDGVDVVVGRDLMKQEHVVVDHHQDRVVARGRVVLGGEADATAGSAADTNLGGAGDGGQNGGASDAYAEGPPAGPAAALAGEPGQAAEASLTGEAGRAAGRTGESGLAAEAAQAGRSAPACESAPASGPRATAGRPRRARRLPSFLREAEHDVGVHLLHAAKAGAGQPWRKEVAQSMTSVMLSALLSEQGEGEDTSHGRSGVEGADVLAPEDARVVNELKEAYPGTFSSELTRLPPLRRVNFSVELIDDKPLPHRAPYPMSEERETALQTIVDGMASAGLIQRHDGPAVCPMFLVKKKTLPGQSPRFRAVLDARPRNAQTAPRSFLAPRVEMLLPRLCGARYVSCVDATQAFYQVRIAPDQEHLFSFCDPAGTVWRLRCMPMGACHAMAVLHDLTSVLFEDFIRNGEMVIYADDWVLISDTREGHVALLRRFVKRCHDEQIVLHPGKSRFFVRQFDFLGFTVRDGAAQPMFDKVEAFRDYPVPSSVTEVRRFLGAANYYSHLIPRFRVWSAPLDALTGLKADSGGGRCSRGFAWGEAEQRSFEHLRDSLASAPVMALPDLSKKQFTLRADASVDGLGAVLEQADKSGALRPVAYFSRKTSDAERRMDIRTLELLAVVAALDKLSMWLGGAVIDVWTDHKSLLYLASSCPVGRRLVRTLDVLQQHRLRWHYTPGSENVVADALSRRVDYMKDDAEEREKVFRRYMGAALRQAAGIQMWPTPTWCLTDRPSRSRRRGAEPRPFTPSPYWLPWARRGCCLPRSWWRASAKDTTATRSSRQLCRRCARGGARDRWTLTTTTTWQTVCCTATMCYTGRSSASQRGTR